MDTGAIGLIFQFQFTVELHRPQCLEGSANYGCYEGMSLDLQFCIVADFDY